MPAIDDVRAFWDANPLWTGEAKEEPGSKAFFDSHTRAYVEMTGAIDQFTTPICAKNAAILDLGCGIGFWPERFGKLGFTNITAADLSPNSLALAKRRCELNQIPAKFCIQNAEAMTFDSETFDHVNCIGVIHHSPNPAASVREIYRVLKPGGRAVISVYYKNLALRAWPVLRLIGSALPSLKGRGRESMLSNSSVDEIVRLYDGADNPIGMSFSKSEFKSILPNATMSFYYHTFPARILPFKLKGTTLKAAEQMLPFMIAVALDKPQ